MQVFYEISSRLSQKKSRKFGQGLNSHFRRETTGKILLVPVDFPLLIDKHDEDNRPLLFTFDKKQLSEGVHFIGAIVPYSFCPQLFCISPSFLKKLLLAKNQKPFIYNLITKKSKIWDTGGMWRGNSVLLHEVLKFCIKHFHF